MLGRTTGILVALFFLVAAFVFGLANLFKLRFEKGDIYSEYSSLRADPLGTKALYEALENLEGVAVRRHFRPMSRLGNGADTTLVFAGMKVISLEYMPEAVIKDLERFMTFGGRVVITLYPVSKKPDFVPGREETGRQTKKDETDETRKKDRSVTGKWGFGLDYVELPKDEDGKHESVTAARQEPREDLPELIFWHSATHLKQLDANWKVVYARENLPVIAFRTLGVGTLVLCTDSYFLSNEAMIDEREPDLLAWTSGGNSKVVFDEFHLGTREEPGIASLLRKYRLHGVFAGILLLAALFVWNRSSAFIPRRVAGSSPRENDLMIGKESAAGFVNLLRRNISPQNILAVCFAEWKKSCAQGREDLISKVAQMEAVVTAETARPARARKPVESYQAISRIFAERSTRK